MRRFFKWTMVIMMLLCLFTASCALAQEEAINLEQEEIGLNVGESVKLHYSTTTGKMKKAGVTYSVDDESVATVSAKGYVKGISAGECTVTITSKYNTDITAEVHVRVMDKLKKIKLTAPSKTVNVGRTMETECILTPETAEGTRIVYKSNKPSVAEVDENGVITGISKGSATITAMAASGKPKATLNVKVEQGPDEIVLSTEELILLLGKSQKVSATVLPDNAKNRKVTWVSSDESIATVSASGKIKALKAGDVMITAIAKGDESVRASITVRCAKPMESLRFDQSEYVLDAYSTLQLSPVVSPADTTVQDVEYIVSNADICTIDENGVITPGHSGTTKVRVRAKDGSGCEAQLTVRTIIRPEAIDFEETTIRLDNNITNGIVRARITPDSATRGTILNWTSSNPSVAAVEGNTNRVLVRTGGWGESILTATTEDGALSASVTIKVGTLREALTVQAVTSKNGVADVTVVNPSDMTMTGFTLKLKWNGGTQTETYENLSLAPGESTVLNITLSDSKAKKVEAAVSEWQSVEGYADAKGEQRYSYRISPGLMTWKGGK